MTDDLYDSLVSQRDHWKDRANAAEAELSALQEEVAQLTSDKNYLSELEHVYDALVRRLGEACPSAASAPHAVDMLVGRAAALQRIADVVRSVRTTRGDSVHYRAVRVIAQILEEGGP